MTYNVFGGTLNLAQSINLHTHVLEATAKASAARQQAARRILHRVCSVVQINSVKPPSHGAACGSVRHGAVVVVNKPRAISV